MKNFKTILLLLVTLLGFSCTDLEEDPVGVFAPESFFKSAGDVEAALYGAYGRLATNGYYGKALPYLLWIRSDMCQYPRGVSAPDVFDEDAYEANSGSIWTLSYNINSAANTVIAGAESVEMSADKRDALIGEARFVRALVYFHLVQLFGNVPYIGEAVTDPESLSDISETPASEIFQNIIADLEFGTQHLPMTQIARSRATKGSAYAMLADVYLNLGDFQKAYDNAKWVIDNATALNYDLEPDYQNLFDASKQDKLHETIFSVDFLGQQRGGGGEGDDQVGSYSTPNGDWAGYSVLIPPKKVFDDWDDRDYRKSVAFLTEAPFGGVMKPYTNFLAPQPYCAKYNRYPGKTANSRRMTDYNYTVYRYAEVLLIAAEASNEVSGPTDEAKGYINQIRARARNAAGTMNSFPEDLVDLPGTKEEFRDLIIEERRLELSFEWKRWYTIKRRNLGEEVFKGPNSFDPQPLFDETKYLLPKPQDELDRNPNLVQNPGY